MPAQLPRYRCSNKELEDALNTLSEAVERALNRNYHLGRGMLGHVDADNVLLEAEGTGDGGAVAPCPFSVKLVLQSGGDYKVSLNAGVVNGNLPSNIFDTFTIGGGSNYYVKLSVTTTGNSVTSVDVVVDTSHPDAPTVTMGTAPDNFDVLVYVLVSVGGKLTPFRVLGCGNVIAVPVIVQQTPKDSPSPGGSAWDLYYTWVFKAG